MIRPLHKNRACSSASAVKIHLRRFGLTAASLLFPNRCRVCRTFQLGMGTFYCPECQAELEAARSQPACPRCAGPIGPFGGSEGFCLQCANRTLRIAGTVRVALYDGAFGALIRAWKYHGQDSLGAPLATWLAEGVRAALWFDRVEAVVPVPTHWRHRFGRPVYAAETLAARAADRLDLPCLPLLRRVRAGPHQIGLSYTQRQANVRGAFAIARGVRIDGARVLLIDDVRTTGATLEECARVLRKGGCQTIYAGVAATAGVAAPTGQPITHI